MTTTTFTPAALKAYRSGWSAYQRAADPYLVIERADRARRPGAWYIGFFDAESGVEKYTGLHAAVADGRLATTTEETS